LCPFSRLDPHHFSLVSVPMARRNKPPTPPPPLFPDPLPATLFYACVLEAPLVGLRPPGPLVIFPLPPLFCLFPCDNGEPLRVTDLPCPPAGLYIERLPSLPLFVAVVPSSFFDGSYHIARSPRRRLVFLPFFPICTWLFLYLLWDHQFLLRLTPRTIEGNVALTSQSPPMRFPSLWTLPPPWPPMTPSFF